MCLLSSSVMSDYFVTLWPVACQAPLSMGFCRQEYWSGLPFPLLGDIPNPGIKPTSLASPALQVDSLILVPPGSPQLNMLDDISQYTHAHVCFIYYKHINLLNK